MKTVKFLFETFTNFLSFDALFVKDWIFGILQAILFLGSFVVSFVILLKEASFREIKATFFALLMAIGFMLVFYALICLGELFVRLVIKIIKTCRR